MSVWDDGDYEPSNVRGTDVSLRVCVCVCVVTADELWKGVLAESGSGARKGRGKRTKRKMKKDLNRGQIIGEGETSVCLSDV